MGKSEINAVERGIGFLRATSGYRTLQLQENHNKKSHLREPDQQCCNFCPATQHRGSTALTQAELMKEATAISQVSPPPGVSSTHSNGEAALLTMNQLGVSPIATPTLPGN